jgi:F-type H+-transporting ATPase subunit gamma
LETLESLNRKRNGAKELKSVVRTMKALAASNLIQFEQAVLALDGYSNTIDLGLVAYFKQKQLQEYIPSKAIASKETASYAIVFGSDQGLVGQFNDSMSDFVVQKIENIAGKKEIWSVGERIELLLADKGLKSIQIFQVPNSVKGITPLVGQLLVKLEENPKLGKLDTVHIFYNKAKPGFGFEPVMMRMLPFDQTWKLKYANTQWPTNKIPQIAGATKATLTALISEYLFVSLFKACAESLASENRSRMNAMQRAEKNIDEMEEGFSFAYNGLRQGSIDEELFDVVSGFEALK